MFDISIRKPKLSLHAPPEHIIPLTSTNQASLSNLVGQLSFSNLPGECQCRVALVRNGRINSTCTEEKEDNTGFRNPVLGELGLAGPRNKQKKKEPFDYESLDKLAQYTTILSDSGKCTFQLAIPSYLPSTAALPPVEISYALIATCVFPDRRILQATHDLRIIRKTAQPLQLQPSRTVTFPDSAFALKVSFSAPVPGPTTTIPTTLHLSGLSLPQTSLMYTTDTRWLVPREIKWRIEETAILISGFPDETGHISMSTATRIVKTRDLSTGRQKLKLKYPFTRPGNTPVTMVDATSMHIPFFPTVPPDARLGDTTALCVAGAHVLHTVLCTHPPSSSAASPQMQTQTRFALFLDYTLHVWLRVGEDIFKADSGVLVNRKMDEVAYSIVCPLQPVEEEGMGTLGMLGLPVYEGVGEGPPGYEVCAR